MKQYKTVYQLFNELPKKPTNWQKIVDLAVLKNYNKYDILCDSDKNPEKLFFIKSGIVRKYIIDENGKEYNKYLLSENQIVLSLTAIATKSTSRFTIECLTDVELYEINYNDLMTVLMQDIELLKLYTNMLHQFFVYMERIEIEKVTLTASQGYDLFCKRNPFIAKNTKLLHIASYLGITAIQLSRIRKELKNS